MFKNQFFRMLFDYRGTITRRQYWGSLLFLSILLFSMVNVPAKWEQISKIAGYSGIQNMDVNVFLTYIFNTVIIIFDISILAVAFSLFAVTLKRSRTIGYSKLSGWLFSIVTYLCYFSLLGYFNYFRYYKADRYASSYFMEDNSLGFIIPVITVIIGLITLCTIVIVIILSEQNTLDNEEEIDYYGYDSISCVFGLIKFSLIYIVVFLIFNYVPLNSISAGWLNFIKLLIIISCIIFYLKIFIKRSRDAGISSAYIITGLLSLIVLIVVFIVLSINNLFNEKPLLYFFVNRFYIVLISAYLLYTYILIALPTKSSDIPES